MGDIFSLSRHLLSEESGMTDLPMTDCCPGSTCPVSSRCLVCDYIDHQCPVWIKVDKSSIHVCPLKEGCRLFRMLMKEEEEEQDVKKM